MLPDRVSRDVLDEIWDLIESVSGGFPSYSSRRKLLPLRFALLFERLPSQVRDRKSRTFFNFVKNGGKHEDVPIYHKVFVGNLCGEKFCNIGWLIVWLEVLGLTAF